MGGSTCVFCGIVAGTVPAAEVLRDDVVVAFLDHSPLFPGHTLVVPAVHHETLADLPDDLVGPYFGRVRRIERAVRSATGAAGSFVAMNNTVSQSVPHLHTHVVPRNRKDGLRGFFWPRTRYGGDDHREEVAAAVRAALAAEDS